MHRITRVRAAVAAAALTALLAVGAVAVAAIPDSTGAINACYGPGGRLSVVDDPLDCARRETSVALGGPTYGYAYSNADFATIGETTTVVGSVALPAGNYLVHGKLDLLGSSSTQESFVVCNLRVEGTTTNSDSVWNTIEPGIPGRLPSESVAMQTSIRLPAGGTMLMTCIRPDGGRGCDRPLPTPGRYSDRRTDDERLTVGGRGRGSSTPPHRTIRAWRPPRTAG